MSEAWLVKFNEVKTYISSQLTSQLFDISGWQSNTYLLESDQITSCDKIHATKAGETFHLYVSCVQQGETYEFGIAKYPQMVVLYTQTMTYAQFQDLVNQGIVLMV